MTTVAATGFVSVTAGAARTIDSKKPANVLTVSDETLIARIASGDPLAMRILYARHHIPVFRFVVRMVRNQAVAEDLLADVFLDLWRQAAKFEGRAAASTWLLAMGRFKALSWLRRRRDEDLDETAAAAIPDPADNPEVALLRKRSGETLRRGIAQLPPAQAEVVDLVYYHDKSIAEVAAIAGIPEATVKTRMFYARRKLAEFVAAA